MEKPSKINAGEVLVHAFAEFTDAHSATEALNALQVGLLMPLSAASAWQSWKDASRSRRVGRACRLQPTWHHRTARPAEKAQVFRGCSVAACWADGVQRPCCRATSWTPWKKGRSRCALSTPQTGILDAQRLAGWAARAGADEGQTSAGAAAAGGAGDAATTPGAGASTGGATAAGAAVKTLTAGAMTGAATAAGAAASGDASTRRLVTGISTLAVCTCFIVNTAN